MHTDESSGMNGDAGPAGARTSIAPAKVQRRLKLQGMPDDAAATVASAMLGATRAQNARHADDVVLIANAVCDRMGVTAAELDDVLAAARLHDIGKTAIPVEVLEKPGPLSESEWELVREHTVIAEEVLSSVAELRGVAKLVRHSHERWDGNGYPDGLRGDEIPLGSRIIFCADAFQAIRSDRPYRAARSSPEALDEVRRCSGTQFDPAVVDALQDAVKELGILAAAGRFSRSRRLTALLAVLAVAIGGTALARTGALSDVGAVSSLGGQLADNAPFPQYGGAFGLGWFAGGGACLGDGCAQHPGAKHPGKGGAASALSVGPAASAVPVSAPTGDNAPAAPAPTSPGDVNQHLDGGNGGGNGGGPVGGDPGGGPQGGPRGDTDEPPDQPPSGDPGAGGGNGGGLGDGFGGGESGDAQGVGQPTDQAAPPSDLAAPPSDLAVPP